MYLIVLSKVVAADTLFR